jgi:hypothetical protein
MTIEELIRRLEMVDPSTPVINGFGHPCLTTYGISFLPKEEPTTIGEMLDRARSIRGANETVWIGWGDREDGLEITLPMVLSWLGCGDALPGPRLEPTEDPDLTDLKRLLEEYAGFVQGEDDSRTARQWVDAIYCAVIDTWFGCGFWAVLEANRGRLK